MAYVLEQHHRRSIRLQGYDYSGEGLYFITICTQNRLCLFGDVVNHKMILNNAWQVAHNCWLEIPKHFPHVVLHEFVIMPNHVHGIIELKNIGNVCVECHANQPPGVGAENFLPLPPPLPQTTIQPRHQFQKMIPRSIASMVKGYKIGVTKWFRNNVPEYVTPQTPVWQRNYYEHIIRNE